MATITSVGSGLWSAAGTWDAGVPVDNDTVVIAAGHTVTMDADTSGFANGIAGLTITSHATTPGMLRFKYDADGTYHLKIKTGTTIAGTNAATFGRILANSDGVWSNTGPLAFGRKAIIDLQGTAYINALYLDIALYCTQPTTSSVQVYKALKTVSGVNAGTDVITMTAPHGWANNTPVMVRSSGAMPGGLAADTVYYVRSASGADLKLSLFAGDPTVDVTSTGSGTIELYDGHSDTATATVNVLDDVSADAAWVTADGHDYVVLVDAAAPENYDQQRVQLTTINAGSLVLSANVDSAQYPGARVFLMSRNVRITSNTTAAINIVAYGAGTHGGVFQCEIRSTAGTGTTFYGSGVIYGTGHTVSGTVSGCSNGVYYGTSHTVSGTVSGCSNGVNGGTGHTVSGTVSGCTYGVNGGTGHTVSGTVSGCSNGVNGGTGHTVSGTVSGCGSGVIYGTSHTVSGTVSGCSNGVYYGTSHTVSGTVSGCSNGVYNGTGWLIGASFAHNMIDLYPNGGYWQGWGVTLAGTTQVSYYKHSQNASTEDRNAAVAILGLGGVDGSVGFWTLGGFCKSATYVVGTHGTPPATLTLVHEMTAEDSDRVTWVEYAIWAKLGQAVTVTFYGKLTGTAAWTARPTVGIYDPTKLWQAPAEALNVSAQMASNTDWQTLTATYTPTYDRELRVRVQAVGGNAGGTGTEQLYWWADIDLGGSGGGAVSISPVRGNL